MAKYSPKENTYKEMYLINKFEKDVMENSLQNMRNDKSNSPHTKTPSQNITTLNNISPNNEKETLEKSNKNKTSLEKTNQDQASNQNDASDTAAILNSSVETEQLPNDTSLPVNANTPSPEKRVHKNLSMENSMLSPADLKKILSTEKRAIKKIKQIARKAPEIRHTRKSTHLLKKPRKVVTVKNPDPLSMITPKSKKRKIDNEDEMVEEIFQNWKV